MAEEGERERKRKMEKEKKNGKKKKGKERVRLARRISRRRLRPVTHARRLGVARRSSVRDARNRKRKRRHSD
jgi:hypothetical protein